MVTTDSKSYKKKVYHSSEYLAYLLDLFEGRLTLNEILEHDMHLIMSMREAKEKQMEERSRQYKKIQRGHDGTPPATAQQNEHGFLNPM